MKINGSGHINRINPYQKQLQQQKNTAEPKQQQDKVQISREAKQLQHTNPLVTQRENKVESLKQQVENGTYQMDATKTAEKMIDFWRGMSGAAKHD